MSEEQDREAMIEFWRWAGKMDEPMTPAALEKYRRDWARMMESKERRRKEREKQP